MFLPNVITLISINFLLVKEMGGHKDLMLLNPDVVTKFLHCQPFLRGLLISKTTFVLKYMSGTTDLIGKIFACVLV
jgi:hypothetical protein